MAKEKSNPWLITNSQLQFADDLLSERPLDKLSVYGLVDLSNLIQAIVLSDKLAVLPGLNDVNHVRDRLKEKGLLTTLGVTRNAERTYNSLKGSWGNYAFMRSLFIMSVGICLSC